MTSTLRAKAPASLSAIFLSLAISSFFATPTFASIGSQIEFLAPAPSPSPNHSLTDSSPSARANFELRVTHFIQAKIEMAQYHHIGVQTVQDSTGKADHLLLLMHSATTHRLDTAMVRLDSQNEPSSVEQDYKLNEMDFAAQPKTMAVCPDPSIQFIAFAPNNNALELQVTRDVANQAKARGLKTIELYVHDATRANYMAYMSCPNIKGNFYDGDANPGLITTNDGVLQSSELAALNFNYHVTNIWLACQAFNDPILSVMVNITKSQKYAAGQNDLLVGPSDRAAACAMIAALKGQPMTAAFQQCYLELDLSSDHWGFGGNGSDIFGQ